jgi:hypothetical protein
MYICRICASLCPCHGMSCTQRHVTVRSMSEGVGVGVALERRPLAHRHVKSPPSVHPISAHYQVTIKARYHCTLSRHTASASYQRVLSRVGYQ